MTKAGTTSEWFFILVHSIFFVQCEEKKNSYKQIWVKSVSKKLEMILNKKCSEISDKKKLTNYNLANCSSQLVSSNTSSCIACHILTLFAHAFIWDAISVISFYSSFLIHICQTLITGSLGIHDTLTVESCSLHYIMQINTNFQHYILKCSVYQNIISHN